MSLLIDIILILSLAILIILILSKFRIPPVIGFLLTGVLIGPSALRLVSSLSEIELLAEIGIILLMFSIGLEFSLEKIRQMFKDFLYFGGLQVILSWLAFYLLLDLYGLSVQQAVLGGFILALSSTAIVFKLLQDGDHLNSPAGIKMTGILLFQDAVLIPAIILLPFLDQLGNAPSLSVFGRVMLAFASVMLILLLSRWILPKIIGLIVNLRIPDMLMVTVFVLLFGISIAAHQLGVSLAMGGFLVGVALSDSDYAHQINTDFIPSRHLFNSIFFISIGMFVNVSFFLAHFTEIFLFLAILITVKILIIMLIFLILRRPLNTGVTVAFTLAHIGEFSFILLKTAQSYQIFDRDIDQIMLTSAILSMFFVPFAFSLGRRLSGYDKLKKASADAGPVSRLTNHTVLAGFGVTGQNIARILKLLSIPYTIIEMNPVTVKKYKAAAESIHYGNIDRRENLILAGISRASLLVVAINDQEASRRTVTMARQLNPSVKIIVRVNFLAHVESIYALGADLVLSQDMETSLSFIQHILKFYQMPDHVSRIQTNMLRKEHYRFFLKKESREAWKIAIFDTVEQDNELFFISPHSKHVGKKLSELTPFHLEDMQIIGIIRGNRIHTDNLRNMVLESLDTLIFSGIHARVYEALTWMEKNN